MFLFTDFKDKKIWKEEQMKWNATVAVRLWGLMMMMECGVNIKYEGDC